MGVGEMARKWRINSRVVRNQHREMAASGGKKGLSVKAAHRRFFVLCRVCMWLAWRPAASGEGLRLIRIMAALGK